MRALRHVPMLLRLAWECGPSVVSAALACRLTGALLPIAMLGVAKAILDAVQVRFTSGVLRDDFWWLVGAECALAITGAILGRLGGFFDALMADRFARHVSVKVMAHAASLDLVMLVSDGLYFNNALAGGSIPGPVPRVAEMDALIALVERAARR